MLTFFFTINFNQYIGTTNPIVMFVVGAAVTLAIVLVVIFVIQIYKRRRQASKLSSSVLAVDTIEMQNETAPEASQNNQVSVSKAFCS